MVKKAFYMIFSITALCNIPVFAMGADQGMISSGETNTGYLIIAPSFMDAFQFYGEAGDRVIINAVKTSGSLDTYMDLYSPAGLKETTTYAFGDQLSWNLQETGLYTVLVQDYLLNDPGTYNIGMTKVPANLSPGIYSPYPPNGDTIIGLSISLSWEPVQGTTGYDIYFGEDVIEALNQIGDHTQSTSITIGALEIGKVYYWHVVAGTNTGDIQGPYWWFIATVPTCSECFGDPVVLQDVTFSSGTICECSAATSITIGPGVTIKNGATIFFRAPTVKLQSGFHAEAGSTLKIEQQK